MHRTRPAPAARLAPFSVAHAALFTCAALLGAGCGGDGGGGGDAPRADLVSRPPDGALSDAAADQGAPPDLRMSSDGAADAGGSPPPDLAGDPFAAPLLGSLAPGADPVDAARDGDLLYLAEGAAGLEIDDLGNPAAPTVKSKLALPAPVTSVAVAGGHAYVALGAFGVGVVDVSNPVVPTVVGLVGVGNGPVGRVAAGTGRYVYATVGATLYAVDVAQPGSPAAAGSPLLLDGTIARLAVTGGTLVAATATGKLHVVTLGGDGSALASASATSFAGAAVGLAAAGGAVALAASGGAVTLWSVADPAHPVVAASLPIADATAVDLARGALLVAAAGGHVRVYGLADPAKPALVADVTDKGPASFVLGFPGVAAYGVAGAVKVVDVAPFVAAFEPSSGQVGVSPAATVRVHFSEAVTLASAQAGLTLAAGGKATLATVTLAADPRVALVRPAAQLAAGAVDVTAAHTIREAYPLGLTLPADQTASFTVGGDATPPSFAGAISATALSATSIRLAWSAGSDDVTPPGKLRYAVYPALAAGKESFDAAALTSAPGETSLVVTGLRPSTTYYFVVRARDEAGNEDAGTVEVSAQTPAGSYFAPVAATLSSASDVRATDADGAIVYLAEGASGLGLYDLADSAAPKLLKRVALPGPATDVFAAGSLAYVGCGTGGVAVVDVRSPGAPVLVGSTALPAGAPVQHLVGYGTWVYASSGATLYAVDVSAPDAPTVKESVALGAAAVALSVSGPRLYAATASSIAVFDTGKIGGGGSPPPVGTWSATGVVRHVEAVGSFFAYVSVAGVGVQLVDLKTPQAATVAWTLPAPDVTAIRSGAAMLAVARAGGWVDTYVATNPFAPLLLSSNATAPGGATFIALPDGKALVGAGTKGQVIDLPPFALGTVPPNGDADASTAVVPLVAFSKPVDAATVAPAIAFADNAGKPVPSTVSVVAGRIARLVPAAALAATTKFVVRLAATVRDPGGQRLAYGLTTRFTTGAGATVPVLDSFAPTRGTVGTAVTITGSRFGGTRGTSTVSFDGVPAAGSDYLSWKDTQIVVRVPRGAGNGTDGAGAVVTVTREDGSSAASSPARLLVTCNALASDPLTGGAIDPDRWRAGDLKYGTATAGPSGVTLLHDGTPGTMSSLSSIGLASRCAVVGDFDVSLTLGSWSGWSVPAKNVITAALALVSGSPPFSFAVGRVTGATCLGDGRDEIESAGEGACAFVGKQPFDGMAKTAVLRLVRKGTAIQATVDFGAGPSLVSSRPNTDPKTPLTIAAFVGTGAGPATPPHGVRLSSFLFRTPK